MPKELDTPPGRDAMGKWRGHIAAVTGRELSVFAEREIYEQFVPLGGDDREAVLQAGHLPGEPLVLRKQLVVVHLPQHPVHVFEGPQAICRRARRRTAIVEGGERHVNCGFVSLSMRN
jgi:hypothetical protein